TLPQGEKTSLCLITVDGVPVETPIEPAPGTYCATVNVAPGVGEVTHEVVFYNAEDEDCEIQVCKLDENGEPIEGWTFQLWTAVADSVDGPSVELGPVKIGEEVTGADGCVTWSELEPGPYAVVEELPQTVGGRTYTKVDGDVEITVYCTDPPTTGMVPPCHVSSRLWAVPVDLRDGCCEASPDVTVTFRNTCEVEVQICKIGIQAEECDPLADSGPVSGWRFTLQRLPDGPVSNLQTGLDGCTQTILLEPGEYRVCEALDPGFVFCSLEVNGVPVDPIPVGDTVCYDFTVGCADVDLAVEPDIEITYANAGGGPTRTPGYWFTHVDAQKAAFECITGSETGTIELCDGCSVTIDDSMAIFWNAKGGNRPTLAMHILAAMFNSCLLSPAPGSIIEDALEVLCNPDATNMQISAVLGPLTEFNESGTEQDV
ncbi:MAG: hypothetical protein GTO22_01930, partial [Gemmatimonadales bacterium]|nr:hypothetical protein [Gemmatimonadales bacterium]